MRSPFQICVACLSFFLGLSKPAQAIDQPSQAAYGKARKLGVIRNPAINESSGIARSIRHPGWFWTHNDSGNKPKLFLIDAKGETRATVTVTGVSSVDWEDITSFQWNGKAFLMVADTGDNRRKRTGSYLHFLEEPAITESDKPQTSSVTATRTLTFQFPDGPKDCEAVAVDAKLGVIVLVSKETRTCGAYELPLNPADTGALTAHRIGTLPFSIATGMDISPDGTRAALVSYLAGCEYTRKSNENWAEAFKRTPRAIALPLRYQGESICFGVDGKSLYLTSEGHNEPLWEITAPPPEPPQ